MDTEAEVGQEALPGSKGPEQGQGTLQGRFWRASQGGGDARLWLYSDW